MKKEPLIYGVVGLILGIVIAWSASLYAVNGGHITMMRSIGMHTDNFMMQHSENCNGLQCTAN